MNESKPIDGRKSIEQIASGGKKREKKKLNKHEYKLHREQQNSL